MIGAGAGDAAKGAARPIPGAEPRGADLSALAAAEEAPRDLALIADGRALTYRELAREVAGALGELRDRGAGPQRPVAVVADRRIDTVVAILALFELGAPAALLHPRQLPRERAALVARTLPDLPAERTIGPSWKRPPVREPPPADPVHADRRPAAYVFTSGSSGHPKAVELSRRALAAGAAASAAHLGWRPGDRWHAFLPLAHVGGLAVLLRCLAGRRTAVVESEARFDAGAVASSMNTHAITLASAVPAMLCDLVEARITPPATLRALLLGGAAAPAALLERATRAGWPVLTTYGMSETGSQLATWPPRRPLDPTRGVGIPLPGVDLDIRGGRIFVRGEMLMTRYLPRGDGSPIGDDGFFDTGDRGELGADGFLRVRGRADDTIVCGGENVDPAEVETALCGSPAVAAAVAAGIPDPRLGEIVAAAIVPSPGADPTTLAADLDDLGRAALAPFKRPRRLEIWSELPMTAAQKPDRGAARARLAASGRLRRPTTRS